MNFLLTPWGLASLSSAGPRFGVAIAEAGGVLTATVTTISATGTASYAFDWRRNGASLGAADAATYDTGGTPGAYSVRVTGTDDTGARAANSNIITIGGEAGGAFSSGFSSGFDVAGGGGFSSGFSDGFEVAA